MYQYVKLSNLNRRDFYKTGGALGLGLITRSAEIAADNVNYSVKLPEKPKGSYTLAIQLYDTKSKRTVEIGLSEKLKVDKFFKLTTINF